MSLLFLSYIMLNEVQTSSIDDTIELSVWLSIGTLQHAAPLTEWIDPTLPVAIIIIVTTPCTIKHTHLIYISRRVDWENPR